PPLGHHPSTAEQTLPNHAATAPPAQLRHLTASPGNTVVGQTNSGDPFELQVAAHTVVVGATGTGKSGTLSAMLAGFHQDPNIPTRFIAGTGKSSTPRIMHTRAMPGPPPIAAAYVDIEKDGPSVKKFVSVIRQSILLRRARLRDAEV
ncbi:FtsK/SpoIIIE domain-containing protein, partial [Mycobacteroides chelonae]